MKDWRISNWVIKPESMFDLTGKVAIVTGGASGIGRAIALGIASFGAKVVIADIDVKGMEEVSNEIKGQNLVVEVDVTNPVSVKNMVKKALQEFGAIDVSFNIPGINIRKPVLELSKDEWDRVVSVNLTGVFCCAKEVGRIMLKRKKGSMINMASARGLVGGPSQSVYSATKAGVIRLTACLAAEWAPFVRVNALAPGYVKTPLLLEAMKDEDWYNRMRQIHLLGRFAEPEEVVGAAVFLASDASSFVTGSVLTVDGGWTAV